MTGIELIARERQEQIEKHGHTVELDVFHNNNDELLMAARGLIDHKYGLIPDSWYNDKNHDVNKMMKKSIVDRLVIAGALIAAEIDRLNASQK